MSTRRARPVITVVDARPMSEVGFAGILAEQPRLSANPVVSLSNHPSTVPREPLSASNAQHEQQVDFDGLQKPLKPQPVPTPAAGPRPAPKPRPRSMVMSNSISLSALNQGPSASNNKSTVVPTLPADRPAVSARPTIIRPMVPKPSTVSKSVELAGDHSKAGSDIGNLIPKQPPPPVLKPKPTVLNRYGSLGELYTTGSNVSSDNSSSTSNALKKPTIIRPSNMPVMPRNAQQQQQMQPPTHKPAETPDESDKDNWKKVAQPTVLSLAALLQKDAAQEESSTSVINEPVDVHKPRPTVIRRSRLPSSDDSTGHQIETRLPKSYEHQNDELSNSSRNHVDDVKHTIEKQPMQNDVNRVSETSGSGTSGTRKPGPRPPPPAVANQNAQPVWQSSKSVTAHQPLKSLPPTKPPPPKVGSTTSASTDARTAPAGTGQRDSVRSRQLPPSHPSTRPKEKHGTSPPLPSRPYPGHPLYHYMCKGPHALALFDYVTAQPDELNFKAGDIIMLDKWVNAEWIIGSSGHSQGMFPVNFVEIQEPLPNGPSMQSAMRSESSPAVSSQSDLITGPRCIARFDYMTDEADDLEFIAGNVIRLVDRINDEWLKGEINGKTGVFPLSFVEILEDLPHPSPTVSHGYGSSYAADKNDNQVKVNEFGSQPFCVAVFDFKGENSEDLSFNVDDKILLLSRVNAEWLKGSINGREGIFPSAFVNIIQDIIDLPPRPKSTSHSDGSNIGHSTLTVSHAHSSASHQTSDLVSGIGERCAVALYDFDGDAAAGDLPFHAGDTIVDIGTVSEEWMSGRIGLQTGMFPSAFVQIT